MKNTLYNWHNYYKVFRNDSTMEATKLILEDLADILHVNVERANGYNVSAYACENMPLKMLLNRELDNTRDSILSLRKLLRERFSTDTDPESNGQLRSIWSDFRPSFKEGDMNIQLHSYEMADLLTLQCYRVAMSRPHIDAISKSTLEFLYQNLLSVYTSVKAFRATHRNNVTQPITYSHGRRSA